MKASVLLGGLGIMPVFASTRERQTGNKMNNFTLENISFVR
jgi:hypothetical protein